MQIKGSQIRLSVDGDYLNCETECVLNVVKETVGKSSSANGKWRYSREGYISWSMEASQHAVLSSFNGSFNSILSRMVMGGEITCSMTAIIDGGTIIDIQGQAIPTNFTLTAGTGLASNNVIFQGTGELFTEFDVFWQIINAQPIEADKDITLDTTQW